MESLNFHVFRFDAWQQYWPIVIGQGLVGFLSSLPAAAAYVASDQSGLRAGYQMPTDYYYVIVRDRPTNPDTGQPDPNPVFDGAPVDLVALIYTPPWPENQP